MESDPEACREVYQDLHNKYPERVFSWKASTTKAKSSISSVCAIFLLAHGCTPVSQPSPREFQLCLWRTVENLEGYLKRRSGHLVQELHESKLVEVKILNHIKSVFDRRSFTRYACVTQSPNSSPKYMTLSPNFVARWSINVGEIQMNCDNHETLKPKKPPKEGIESKFWGAILFFLYGIFIRRSIRTLIATIVLKLEDDPIYSVTIRRIFATYHDIHVGMYSGRGCFVAGNFRPGTRIGRYAAVYSTVVGFDANHPMNTKSTHALFYNPKLGYAKKDLLSRTKLTIGNDVWIGHNAIILSTVSSIGDGAIIGAGTVLHQDVPPYAVVVGNPGRIVRYRFSPETIEKLLEEKWWDKSFEELLPQIETFQKPLDGGDRIR